jgi:tyrosine-protein kinase Etk/Wzc
VEKGISDLQVQLVDLHHRFTDGHPLVSTLKRKSAELEAEKERLERRMKSLPATELDSARLMRDAKVATELYLVLLNKAQELRVVKEGTVGNVRILDTAVVPIQPVGPAPLRLFALAAVVGLAAGIGLAFLRQDLAGGIEDPEEVERRIGLPVYAIVPHSVREERLARIRRKARRASLLAGAASRDPAVEAVRSLRTALQFALVKAPNQVVAILGPAPAVGRSFVAANLAAVAAETGKRVVVIDCDMRNARLHRYLGVSGHPGLSELLGGTVAIHEAIRPSGIPGLDLLAAGGSPPNPSALLSGDRFVRIVAELAAQYDHVFLDTPPVLAVTDAAIVGRVAGVNLLVLGARRRSCREGAAAVKTFEQAGARLGGVVLNDVCRAMSRRRRYHGHPVGD